MENMPIVQETKDGGYFWEAKFTHFHLKVYVPKTKLDVKTLNYGFVAPYLLVFEEKQMSIEEAIAFSREKGFEQLAAQYASSVAFVYPTTSAGWENASTEILSEIYSNSKIHEYFDRGVVINHNRFTKTVDGYFIRGAIFRVCLYGFGKSADFIAKNYIEHFEGDGLWGRADCAPILCAMEGLSVIPEIKAVDVPVMSVGNSKECNDAIMKAAKYYHFVDSLDAQKEYGVFGKQFRRMLGEMEIDVDLEQEGMVIEPGIVELKTSEDNLGDDQGTETHKVGYFAFYNKEIVTTEKCPLLLCFHGGGDSAFYISYISGWANIAHKYGFLLVSIENHLNSTATEMVALLEQLKKQYPIDESRIYASGFSMGGCKSWDLIQEYPEILAAAAPMDATFEVGDNVFGAHMRGELNTTISVPVFYSGGEITPLPELPFQEKKCYDRMKYVLDLNHVDKPYDILFDEQDKWENPIWGIDGDERIQKFDASRDSTLTMEMFYSKEKCYSIFAGVSGQGHECRKHTCEHAWRFMSCFCRKDGKIVGGDISQIRDILKEEI